MRRWVCIITLLAGFASDGYVRAARVPRPVPVERLLPLARRDRGLPGDAWWTRR